jgi:hypothetical protein
MRITIRTIGLLGSLLFGTAFWFTFGVPGGVEEVAKDFIKERVEQKTKEKIETLSIIKKDSKLSNIVKRLSKNKEKEIEALKAQLQSKSYEKAALIIAEMRDLNCECRKKYTQSMKEHLEFKLLSLQSANEKLTDFMKSKYMDVVKNLTNDLRIFTGSNLLIFIILLLVSLSKPKAIKHLFLPGILLVISTALSSYFYLFEQNWFFTIIYNDFLGFWYLAWVGLIFAVLCDIVFNKARVTSEVINGILNAAGSALSVAPC